MNYTLLVSLMIVVVTQILAYLQLQSQFFWTWAKDHPILMSLLGFPISIGLIYFTKFCAVAFEGQTWPGRLIGFSVGAIVFALMSHYIMNEPFTLKTTTCLILAFLILLIQIFIK